MAIHLTVEHRDGGQTKTTVWPATEVAFEQHFQKPWAASWTEDPPRESYLYFSAWHSIYDEKRTALEFSDWLRTVATVTIDIEASKEDTASGPLAQAPLPGSSQP